MFQVVWQSLINFITWLKVEKINSLIIQKFTSIFPWFWVETLPFILKLNLRSVVSCHLLEEWFRSQNCSHKNELQIH